MNFDFRLSLGLFKKFNKSSKYKGFSVTKKQTQQRTTEKSLKGGKKHKPFGLKHNCKLKAI